MGYMSWLFALIVVAIPARAESFKLGQYVGSVEMEGATTRIPLVLDALIHQPADLKEFPSLRVITRLSLGGKNGREYLAEDFEVPTFQFETETLYLEDQKNDLAFTLTASENKRLRGEIRIRSTFQTGTVDLKLQDDEPGEEEEGQRPTLPVLPSLAGNYEGSCGQEKSTLQLLTARDIGQPTLSTSGLRHYQITGYLGSSKSCGSTGGTCVSQYYHAGNYDFLSGDLTLESKRDLTVCRVDDQTISCEVTRGSEVETCDFKRTAGPTGTDSIFLRSHRVAATAAERKALPLQAPPFHADLVSALRGDFFGYVHHEINDRYQLVRLNIIPSVSTENPHVQNEVFVTTTLYSHFGDTKSSPSVSYPFQRKSLYIRPGFTLEHEDRDVFLILDDWKAGYIKGTYYSKQFGKVGTIELVKGRVPALDASAIKVADFSGRYSNGSRRAHLSLMHQSSLTGKNTASIRGDVNPVINVITSQVIKEATYDFYTDSLSLWIDEPDELNRIIMGIPGPGAVDLIWPGALKWGIQMGKFQYATYGRKP
jgi:hypothetical protein